MYLLHGKDEKRLLVVQGKAVFETFQHSPHPHFRQVNDFSNTFLGKIVDGTINA